MAQTLLTFCFTCLTAPALGFPPVWALVAFSGISILYILVVRARIFNALEAAVTCEILLILLLGMLATYRGYSEPSP